MSNGIPNEDRVLGEALARSIEAQSPPQTPFARSRIAMRLERPQRRFTFAPMLGAAAAIVLALALGSWLLELRADRDRSIATAPTASPDAATAVPSPVPSPSATAPAGASTPAPVTSLRVFFPRAGLPPVSAIVMGAGPQASAEDRIRSRLEALNPARSPAVPPGAFNPFPLSDPAQLRVASVVVSGDTASVDFALPDGGWRWSGDEPQVRGLIQELVYTATEEPGIRRVTITENGGKPTSIGGVAVASPLSREDVFGYAHPGDTRPYIGIGEPILVPSVATSYSVDQFAPGLARFVIRVDSDPLLARHLPQYSVELRRNDDAAHPELGKFVLVVSVPNARDTTTPTTTLVDRSPLRAIVASQGAPAPAAGITYTLGLDDQRPWRPIELYDPDRIVIDIGGAPGGISDDGNTVVYAPTPGTTVRTSFDVGGVVRAFEAGYLWRARDASGRVIGSGHGTANIGTAPFWGGYQSKVALPPGTTGTVTLEVFQLSARDGSEISKVAIPLTVR